MSAWDGGGPAFPVVAETGVGHAAAFRGMTLRDWFAGQALVGLDNEDRSAIVSVAPERDVAETMAHMAYRIADAMLAERERERG